MTRPALLAAAAVATAVATLRRRRVAHTGSDELWREATADASR